MHEGVITTTERWDLLGTDKADVRTVIIGPHFSTSCATRAFHVRVITEAGKYSLTPVSIVSTFCKSNRRHRLHCVR